MPVAARLLGMRVRILPGTWLSVSRVVYCQVEVCASGWSPKQRKSTECGGPSACDCKPSSGEAMTWNPVETLQEKTLPFSVRLQDWRQHFAHTSAACNTQTYHFFLGSKEEQQENCLEFGCQVYQVFLLLIRRPSRRLYHTKNITWSKNGASRRPYCWSSTPNPCWSSTPNPPTKEVVV